MTETLLLTDVGPATGRVVPTPTPTPAHWAEVDLQLVRATQAGLPLVPRPYHALADSLGIPVEVVIARLGAMLEGGAIRRIGAVPNHYALGYTANGMSVWDVKVEQVDGVGEWLGGRPEVSHCYRRPRATDWPYNLFAMFHGRSRESVLIQVLTAAAAMNEVFPEACAGHDVLFSTAILKKTGLRLA